VEDGGQGLPAVLEAQLYEMLNAANHGWTSAGPAAWRHECIKLSRVGRSSDLPGRSPGEWLATMCLTEPHPSDLGLVLKAVPCRTTWKAASRSVAQDLYLRRRTRLTDNIVHLVLACPTAPAERPVAVPGASSTGMDQAGVLRAHRRKMGLHGSPPA
jgi:hypothetical protein